MTYAEQLVLHRRRLGMNQDEYAALLSRRQGLKYTWRDVMDAEHGRKNLGPVALVPSKPLPHEWCFLQRRRRGLRQSEVAVLVGCSRPWLNRMEKGLEDCEKLVGYWRRAL